MPGPFQRTIKWGTITGVAIAMIQWLVFYMILDPNTPPPAWFSVIQFLIAFTGVILCVKEYRDHDLNGEISYGKAFSTGLLTMLWVTIVVMMYVYISTKLSPDRIEIMKETATEAIQKQYDDGKLSEKQFESAMEMTEKLMQPLWLTLITFFNIFIPGVILSLLAAWLHKVFFKPVNAES